MKFLIILASLIFINASCSASKTNSEGILIEYSTQSRGTFKHVVISKKSISTVQKHNGTPSVKSCSDKNWKSILNHLKNIDLENINHLKAPSEKRFFDGAAIGNFKIIANGKTYETPPFDHGNPPQEIAQLVKEMLSISETID